MDAAKPLDERFTGKRQRSTGKPPAVTCGQLAVFIRWWVEQVNRVLGIATDPSLFKGKASGRYDPRRHMAYLASLERLFQGVHEVLLFSERSESARLRAAYDTLDCLDGMRLGSFADFTTPFEGSEGTRPTEEQPARRRRRSSPPGLPGRRRRPEPGQRPVLPQPAPHRQWSDRAAGRVAVGVLGQDHP